MFKASSVSCKDLRVAAYLGSCARLMCSVGSSSTFLATCARLLTSAAGDSTWVSCQASLGSLPRSRSSRSVCRFRPVLDGDTLMRHVQECIRLRFGNRHGLPKNLVQASCQVKDKQALLQNVRSSSKLWTFTSCCGGRGPLRFLELQNTKSTPCGVFTLLLC